MRSNKVPRARDVQFSSPGDSTMCNRIIFGNATLVPAPRRVDFPAFLRGLRLPSTNNGTTVQVFACTVVWSFSERITTAARIMRLTDWTVLQQISSCVRGTKYRRNRASEKHCRHACQRSTSAEILAVALPHGPDCITSEAWEKFLKNCPAGRNSAGTFKQTFASYSCNMARANHVHVPHTVAPARWNESWALNV